MGWKRDAVAFVFSTINCLFQQKGSYERSFHMAFDSLSRWFQLECPRIPSAVKIQLFVYRTHVDLLYEGLKLHQQILEAALRIIQSLVSTGGILPHPSFLTAHLESVRNFFLHFKIPSLEILVTDSALRELLKSSCSANRLHFGCWRISFWRHLSLR